MSADVLHTEIKTEVESNDIVEEEENDESDNSGMDLMFENDDSDGLDELNEILNELKPSKNVLKKPKNKQPRKKKVEQPVKTDDNYKTENEILLEKMVFGDKEGLISKLSGSNEKIAGDKKAVKRKPVWEDSDDENIKTGQVKRQTKHTGSLDHLDKNKSYKEYLTNNYKRIVETPKWADLDRKQEVDSDEEILRTVGHITSGSVSTLQAKILGFKILKDLNRATYSEGKITSVRYHPTSTVAMVTGYYGIASFYAIDGYKNEKLHNIKFKKFPITCANFLQSGNRAIFGGVKDFYYSYDLIKAQETAHRLPKDVTNFKKFEISPCGEFIAVLGRSGEVFLMHTKSGELLHTFKQENPAQDVKFSLDDTKRLFCNSSLHDITVFDIRKQRAEHLFTDDGCISGKTLAISPNSRMLATGSNEGVVNIYNYNNVLLSKFPKPDKIIYNLTTAISDMKFNHSSEMLGFCSEAVPDAVKIVHFPSATVFANFPNQKPNYGCIKTLEFSPMSGYLALGSTTKRVPLLRLKHFNNY